MHISSSSQSSIALLKDVLAYGRLTDPPPLLYPLAYPLTTPIPYPYAYWGGLWVSQRVWGGRGAELVNQPPYEVVEHRIIVMFSNKRSQAKVATVYFSIDSI